MLSKIVFEYIYCMFWRCSILGNRRSLPPLYHVSKKVVYHIPIPHIKHSINQVTIIWSLSHNMCPKSLTCRAINQVVDLKASLIRCSIQRKNMEQSKNKVWTQDLQNQISNIMFRNQETKILSTELT